MKKEEKEFIKNWFYSDLNIELEISFENEKGILILESNAYYSDGKRYKGDKRVIIYDDDYEDGKIYNFLTKNFEKYFYGEYSLEEILNFLEELEENGLKIKVL